MVLAPQPVQSTTGWPPQSQMDYPKGESIGGAPSCCTPKSQSVGGRTSDRSANRACNSKCPPHPFSFPESRTFTCMVCTCVCCCGACCYEGGECTDETEANCAAYGGDWKGKGSQCIDNPCGCTTDDDCCGDYRFTCGGTTYTGYTTAAECASASATICGTSPPVPCFCGDIDPYCCGGTCQNEPCDPT